MRVSAPAWLAARSSKCGPSYVGLVNLAVRKVAAGAACVCSLPSGSLLPMTALALHSTTTTHDSLCRSAPHATARNCVLVSQPRCGTVQVCCSEQSKACHRAASRMCLYSCASGKHSKQACVLLACCDWGCSSCGDCCELCRGVSLSSRCCRCILVLFLSVRCSLLLCRG